MNSTPYEMQAYDKAYKIRRVQEDERDWMMGQYILSAIGSFMPKSKAKYVEEPFLHKLLDDTDDSQDVERYEKKAMAEMQVYIGLLNSQNELPQTVFKDIKKET